MEKKIVIPKEFHEKESAKAFFLIFANVTFLLAAGSIAWHINNWLVYSVVFVLVGARGQACYILQHEATHGLLFANRSLNEMVGVLLSAMLGTRFYEGRRLHMIHHQCTGQEDDPNTYWHEVKSKLPGWSTIKFFLGQLTGKRLLRLLIHSYSLFTNLFSQRQQRKEVNKDKPIHKEAIAIDSKQLMREFLIDNSALVIVQSTIIIMISLISSPFMYIFFYFAPLISLTAFFESIRSFSEHVLPGIEPRSEPEKSRSFYMRASKLEQFFISQYHFHYHHVHHLYPNVVTFKMPKLHQWLQKNDRHYTERFIERKGYINTAIAYICNQPIAGSGKYYPRSKLAHETH